MTSTLCFATPAQVVACNDHIQLTVAGDVAGGDPTHLVEIHEVLVRASERAVTMAKLHLHIARCPGDEIEMPVLVQVCDRQASVDPDEVGIVCRLELRGG